MIDPGLLSPDGNTDDVAPWGRVSIADPGEHVSEPGEIETQAHHLLGLTEIPVEWFDALDDDPWTPSNNDLDPTPEHWDDYEPFWHTARDWVEPHPDMYGYRCSTGWLHVGYRRSPVPAVGMARLPPRNATYD